MRRHRTAVPILLVVAVVVGFLAVFATWTKRQALDSNNWSNTSAKLIEDPQIQAALGSYLTAQLFSNVDVAAELRRRLPPQVQGLAGPVAGGLRNLAEQRVPKMLARPVVQDAWVKANEATHKQLIRVLDNKGTAVSTANGDVVLNTQALLQQLARDVGIGAEIPSLPPKAGQLVIMRSDNLATAQDVAKGVRGLSIILTILMLGIFALAVWLAKGWRREVLRSVGWCFVAIGLLSLLVRRVAGNQVVDGLVQADSVKGAGHQVWLIGTSLLYAIAIAMVIYGLVIVAAAWLAGPSRWGVAARRQLAPILRERPAVAYGAVAVVYLLVLAWGPTPALRNFVPIVLIGILLVIGVAALRRQAAREFPAAGQPDGNGRPPGPPDLKPDKDLALGASS
jgi:hypothetical protein